MTFEEAHEILLKSFDQAVERLRRIHADLEYLNPGTEEHQQVTEDIRGIGQQLFHVKDLRAELKKLMERNHV